MLTFLRWYQSFLSHLQIEAGHRWRWIASRGWERRSRRGWPQSQMTGGGSQFCQLWNNKPHIAKKLLRGICTFRSRLKALGVQSHRSPPRSSLCTRKSSRRCRRWPWSSRCVRGYQTGSACNRRTELSDVPARSVFSSTTFQLKHHNSWAAPKHAVTNPNVEVVAVGQLMVAHCLQIDGFEGEVDAHW